MIPEPVLHRYTPALTLPSLDSICITKLVFLLGELRAIKVNVLLHNEHLHLHRYTVMSKECSQISTTLGQHMYTENFQLLHSVPGVKTP